MNLLMDHQQNVLYPTYRVNLLEMGWAEGGGAAPPPPPPLFNVKCMISSMNIFNVAFFGFIFLFNESNKEVFSLGSV